MRMHLFAAALLAGYVLLCPSRAFSTTPEGEQAPDFELADLSGTVASLSDHRGSVVVLNFWATWCPECISEMPLLNGFAEQYGPRGVTVLSVSVDRSRDALRAYLAAHPLRFTVLLDESGDVFVKRYRMRALPATVIVDRRGRISARLFGRQDFLSRHFRNRIEELLKRGNDP